MAFDTLLVHRIAEPTPDFLTPLYNNLNLGVSNMIEICRVRHWWRIAERLAWIVVKLKLCFLLGDVTQFNCGGSKLIF